MAWMHVEKKLELFLLVWCRLHVARQTCTIFQGAYCDIILVCTQGQGGIAGVYISMVELFKFKGISFTSRRNKTGPRIDPCRTPCQMTDFGFGCYMPYFHKLLSPI